MWRSVCSLIMCFSYRYRAHTRRANNRYCFHSVAPCSDEQKHRSDSSILTMMLLIWLHNGNKLCRKIYALIPFLVFYYFFISIFPFVFAPYPRIGAHLIGKRLHFRLNSVDWPTERASAAVRQIVHADGFACELHTTCLAWKRKHVSLAVCTSIRWIGNRRKTKIIGNETTTEKRETSRTNGISYGTRMARDGIILEKVIVWRWSRVCIHWMFWKPINRR